MVYLVLSSVSIIDFSAGEAGEDVRNSKAVDGATEVRLDATTELMCYICEPHQNRFY